MAIHFIKHVRIHDIWCRIRLNHSQAHRVVWIKSKVNKKLSGDRFLGEEREAGEATIDERRNRLKYKWQRSESEPSLAVTFARSFSTHCLAHFSTWRAWHFWRKRKVTRCFGLWNKIRAKTPSEHGNRWLRNEEKQSVMRANKQESRKQQKRRKEKKNV